MLVEDDVKTGPQNPAPTAADRAPEPPVPLPEESTPESPADEVPAADVPAEEVPAAEVPADEVLADEVPTVGPEVADPAPEAVEVEGPDTDADPVEAVDAGVAEPTPETSVEPTPEPETTPVPPRFDLGLDDEPAEPWGGEGQTFESGTAFDLVRPEPDEDPDPEYEVSEPDLSETFVSTAGSGRPDLSAPQLTDPAPMFSVPEDQLDTYPETADATSAPVEATPETVDEPSGFRLPGLSVFGRRKATEPAPIEDAGTDEPRVEVADAVALEEPTADAAVDEAPPPPSAWAETTPVGASDPGSPFVESPIDPFADAPPVEEPFDEPVDEPVGESVAEPAADAPEPAHEPVVEEVEPAADAPEPAHEPVVEEVEPMEPTEPVATEEPLEQPSPFVPPAARKPVFDEDHPAIELTEPDLTEKLDAPELYVTETASHEDRPPALLTVDSVPGATIAQAVDVVTAVASAANEVEIAEALDRTMAQLRERAAQLGGEAVISVHTEVQEIGGGFLVIASGTAVTLA
ncbi:MAG: heavy metal-binding domain-containing protein [Acidimicrobiia bacterium]